MSTRWMRFGRVETVTAMMTVGLATLLLGFAGPGCQTATPSGGGNTCAAGIAALNALLDEFDETGDTALECAYVALEIELLGRNCIDEEQLDGLTREDLEIQLEDADCP
ncbi:MAG: hypothetical protein GY842_25405 [bacterium]|nr:hypothetical protein [bacterium]